MSTDFGYTSQVFGSIHDVDPRAWDALAAPSDLAMDRRTLAVQETHLKGQMQFAYFLIQSSAGEPVACAALSLYVVDAAASAPKPVRRLASVIRKVWPGVLRFRMASCGLPIPAGTNHFRIAQHADPAVILPVLERALRAWARRQHASLLVFKEFDDSEIPRLGPLTAAGYLHGSIPPMHHLPAAFSSFEAYVAALKSRYRNQIRRSQKKAQVAGLRALYVRDPAQIARLFTDDVHALYTAVWERSAYRQEHFPPQFFRDLAAAFPEQSSLTLLCRGEQVLAFTFGLAEPQGYHSLYSGVAYDLNDEAHLYFNLFYEDLDHAFRLNPPDIQLGHTADDFKSRLGSTQRPLYAFVRATNPVLNLLLHAGGRFLFPSLPAVKPHDVFHQPPPARTKPRIPPRHPKPPNPRVSSRRRGDVPSHTAGSSTNRPLLDVIARHPATAAGSPARSPAGSSPPAPTPPATPL